MRKIYLVLISIFSIISVSAQTKIAVKASWNLASARVRYVDEFSGVDIKQPSNYVNGLGLGFLFKIPFDDVLHFSPSIGYNMRGYIYKPTYGDTLEYHNTIHYIDITPSLSADFPVGERKNTFVISAGPQLSFAVSGTEKLKTAAGSSSKKMIINTDGGYSLFDLGFSSGIAFHTPKIFVEAGYLLGLANINNDYLKDHRNIRNKMLTLTFGYYIK